MTLPRWVSVLSIIATTLMAIDLTTAVSFGLPPKVVGAVFVVSSLCSGLAKALADGDGNGTPDVWDKKDA